jgi:hypothetical protein
VMNTQSMSISEWDTSRDAACIFALLDRTILRSFRPPFLGCCPISASVPQIRSSPWDCREFRKMFGAPTNRRGAPRINCGPLSSLIVRPVGNCIWTIAECLRRLLRARGGARRKR